MLSIRRTLARSIAAAALGVAMTAAPAAASPTAPAAQCLIAPGVYGIVDSTGKVVGLLIVYPDCRMEVYKRSPE